MKRKWCALLVCAMIVSLGLAGCSSDDTSVSSTGDTIKASTEAIFTGQVLNVLDKPMAGVAVTLYAKNKYTTKTDSYGNYMITVSLGDVLATPGGGSNAKDDDINIDEDGDIIERTFPIEIEEKGFAIFRQLVHFECTIGYTDGTGAVVLLSQVGQCIPTVWLDPFVDNFKFTVYAQGVPAPYATVSLFAESMDNFQVTSEKCGDDGGCWDEGWYETGVIQLHADANGVVEIKAEDGIPAQDYDVFAAPYDINGDGIFEYDASNETQPWGGFDLCIGDGLLDLIYNQETDSYVITQTAFAPSVILNDGEGCIDVVFCNLEDLDNIPQEQSANFQIIVMLARPIMVNADGVTIPGGQQLVTSLFKLSAGDGTLIPLTLASNTGNYLFVLKPMNTLTPAGNGYSFNIDLDNAVAFSGDDAGCCHSQESWAFNIYDPTASTIASITPAIDLQGFDAFETYLVDWNDIWKVWYEDADECFPAESSGWIQMGTIRLSWAAAADCNGYDVYIKDSDTAWQLVSECDVTYTYNDGQFVEANIAVDGEDYDYLNSFYCDPAVEDGGFDYYEPFTTFAPFYAGNMVQIIIMPKNINGIAQDPNYDATIVGLLLQDNLGPVIAGKSGYGGKYPAEAWFYPYSFGPDRDKFDTCTYYDDTEIAILSQEPLKDVELNAEEPGLYGAWHFSGSFRVARAYWDDLDLALIDGQGVPYPSNRAYILVDLEPTVSTTLTEDYVGYGAFLYVGSTELFAGGDRIKVTDAEDNSWGDNVELLNITGRMGLNSTISSDIAAEGSKVYWNGPVTSGYEEVTGTLAANYCDWLGWILVEDATGIDGSSLILSPEKVYVNGVSNNVYRGVFDGLGLDSNLTDAYDPGTEITGITPSGASALVDGDQGIDTTIDIYNVNDGPFAVGDLVVFDIGDNAFLRTVTAVPSPGEITVYPSVSVLDNMTVNRYETFTTAFAFGYPMIRLNNSWGIQLGSTITLDPEGLSDYGAMSAVVTGVAYDANISGVGSNVYGVVIDRLLLDEQEQAACYNNGTPFVNDSSRGPDALQVKLKDRSGNDSSAWFDQIGYEEVGGVWSIF